MRESNTPKNEVDWNSKESNQLLNAFLSIESKDGAKRFLRDLMTKSEIEEFSRRLEAARLLTRSVQYCEIIDKTGLSSTTVARISKWLKGPLGGYRLVLNSLHHHNHSKLEKGLS